MTKPDTLTAAERERIRRLLDYRPAGSPTIVPPELYERARDLMRRGEVYLRPPTLSFNGRELRGVTHIDVQRRSRADYDLDDLTVYSNVRIPVMRVAGASRATTLQYLAIGALVGEEPGAASFVDSTLREIASHGVRPCFHADCLDASDFLTLCRHTFPAKPQETPTR